jgi:hypothetical protein
MTNLLGSRRRICMPLSWMASLVVVVQFAWAQESSRSSAETSTTVEAPTPPADATKYDLRYKLSTGDVLRFDVTHSASIRSTIDETTQAAQTKTDSVKLWKVTDVLPNGDIEFMNVVERVHMVNQLPDRDPTEYDSDRDKTPPPGFEDAAKSVGVPLSVVRMTPRGEIVRRDAKFRHLNVSDDAQIVVRLPNEPVAVGATWDEPFDIKIELQNGQSKSVQTRRHHKLARVENDVATIEVAYQILSPVDATEEAQLIERLMTGEVRFNMATGRIAGQKMEIDKKILGFAGPTSSLQYLMRMEEKAVSAPAKKVAAEIAEPPTNQSTSTTANRSSTKTPSTSAAVTPTQKPAAQTATNPRRPVRPTRTATRSRRAPNGARGYSR